MATTTRIEWKEGQRPRTLTCQGKVRKSTALMAAYAARGLEFSGVKFAEWKRITSPDVIVAKTKTGYFDGLKV
jgi:hypothetical protein